VVIIDQRIVVNGAMMFWFTGLTGVKPKQIFQYFFKTLKDALPFLLIILACKLFNPFPHTHVTGLKLPLDYLALVLISVIVFLIYAYFYFLKNKMIREELSRLVGIHKARKA
jgi:hypothetical protein